MIVSNDFDFLNPDILKTICHAMKRHGEQLTSNHRVYLYITPKTTMLTELAPGASDYQPIVYVAEPLNKNTSLLFLAVDARNHENMVPTASMSYSDFIEAYS